MTHSIAIDFDGVIHKYSKGWHDGSIYDEPVPLAFEYIQGLMKTYAVFVFTARYVEQVKKWIEEKSGIPCVTKDYSPEEPFWSTKGKLLVTNHKYGAIAYIDDRAIRFYNWDQAITELYKVIK